MIITYIIVLLALFYVLGASADLVVSKIKTIAEKFNIGILSLGMVLGALTTLPEFFVGVNSIILDVPELYFGTLMGGIITILCFILGFSIVLNRNVKTDGNYMSILPESFTLLLPMVLAFTKGYLNELDGLILIFIYLMFLYKNSLEHIHIKKEDLAATDISLSKSFFWITLGLALVVISSHGIVKITTNLLSAYNVPAIIIGLLVFSVGTNLPEIVITLKSWSRHVPELSLSHIMGSALANILVLGVMVSFKPIQLNIDASYKFLFIAMIAALYAVSVFYKSDANFTKKEGYRLLTIYLIFVLGQLWFS